MNKIIVLPAVLVVLSHGSPISLKNVRSITSTNMNNSKGCAGLLGPEDGSGEQ
jgi:hypothetical protein